MCPLANPTDKGTPTQGRAAHQQETPCPEAESALAGPRIESAGPESTLQDHFGIFHSVPFPLIACMLDWTLRELLGRRYMQWIDKQEASIDSTMD